MPNLPSASQDSPLISIGMPAHNAERYVGAAIESVLRQTFGDWELIIINDGSTDATAERIASYRDPRIRWFSQENLGPPAAYNRALAQSRGRYFAILNADDVCYPDRLESQLRFYEGGGPRVLFSPVDFIDAEGNAVTGEHFLSGRFPAEPHTRAETVERFFTRGNFFSTPTLFTERKILLEAGLFHPALFTLQDFDMWVRLVKKHDLVPLPKPTVQYRIHPDNISGPPRNDQDFRRGVRVHNEYHLLMRRFFDGMPAELFHDAFKDRLIRPDCATDLEHRCEQAFLYLKSSDRRCQLIGLEKMDGLLADPEGARVLSDLYGFNSVSFAHGPLADVDVERIVPKPAAAQRDEPAIQSGHPPIDNYLARSYDAIPGMSSRFAAAICGRLVRSQAEQGIGGDIVEVGVFEGRFLIALALGLEPGERALGIDVFAWPDDGVLDRFLANCDSNGLPRESVLPWKTDANALQPGDLKAKLEGRQVRFAHLDADHHCQFLSNDLELAHAALHPAGIICVDDMLHPSYPTLITPVLEYLRRHPEMRVLCVIDREDVVAAAKFVLCHEDWIWPYHQALNAAFGPYRFYIDANFETHGAVVLTPRPRVIELTRGETLGHG